MVSGPAHLDGRGRLWEVWAQRRREDGTRETKRIDSTKAGMHMAAACPKAEPHEVAEVVALPRRRRSRRVITP